MNTNFCSQSTNEAVVPQAIGADVAMPLELMEPSGNIRPLDNAYVEELVAIFERETIKKEYAIIVATNNLPGSDQSKPWRIINGQHRFHAAMRYYAGHNTPNEQRTYPVLKYPALKPAEIIFLGANAGVRTQDDSKHQRVLNIRRALETGATLPPVYFQRIYTGKDDVEAKNATTQLTNVAKFPCKAKFLRCCYESDHLLTANTKKTPSLTHKEYVTKASEYLPGMNEAGVYFPNYPDSLTARVYRTYNLLIHSTGLFFEGYSVVYKLLYNGVSNVISLEQCDDLLKFVTSIHPEGVTEEQKDELAKGNIRNLLVGLKVFLDTLEKKLVEAHLPLHADWKRDQEERSFSSHLNCAEIYWLFQHSLSPIEVEDETEYCASFPFSNQFSAFLEALSIMRLPGTNPEVVLKQNKSVMKYMTDFIANRNYFVERSQTAVQPVVVGESMEPDLVYDSRRGHCKFRAFYANVFDFLTQCFEKKLKYNVVFGDLPVIYPN